MTESWDLAVHEESILRQACRAADRLDAMAAALASEPLVVTNARGDQIPHPVLCESRQQSQLPARLVAALGLPAGDVDTQRQSRSWPAYRGFYGTVPGSAA